MLKVATLGQAVELIYQARDTRMHVALADSGLDRATYSETTGMPSPWNWMMRSAISAVIIGSPLPLSSIFSDPSERDGPIGARLASGSG